MKRYLFMLVFVIACLLSLIGQPAYAGKPNPKICKQLPNGNVQKNNCVTVTPTATFTVMPTRTRRPTNTPYASPTFFTKTPRPTATVSPTSTPKILPTKTATPTFPPPNTPNPAFSPTPTLWCNPGCIFLPS